LVAGVLTGTDPGEIDMPVTWLIDARTLAWFFTYSPFRLPEGRDMSDENDGFSKGLKIGLGIVAGIFGLSFLGCCGLIALGSFGQAVNDAQKASLKVRSTSFENTKTSGDYYYYSWRAEIENTGSTDVDAFGRVKLLDYSGMEIDSTNFRETFRAGEQKAVTGRILANSSNAADASEIKVSLP